MKVHHWQMGVSRRIQWSRASPASDPRCWCPRLTGCEKPHTSRLNDHSWEPVSGLHAGVGPPNKTHLVGLKRFASQGANDVVVRSHLADGEREADLNNAGRVVPRGAGNGSSAMSSVPSTASPLTVTLRTARSDWNASISAKARKFRVRSCVGITARIAPAAATR